MSGQMLAALEAAVLLRTFPKSNVDVYCLILESGGSDLAVCISAASLALADAGIEMSDLVSACSVVSNSSYSSAQSHIQEDRHAHFGPLNALLHTGNCWPICTCRRRVSLPQPIKGFPMLLRGLTCKATIVPLTACW